MQSRAFSFPPQFGGRGTERGICFPRNRETSEGIGTRQPTWQPADLRRSRIQPRHKLKETRAALAPELRIAAFHPPRYFLPPPPVSSPNVGWSLVPVILMCRSDPPFLPLKNGSAAFKKKDFAPVVVCESFACSSKSPWKSIAVLSRL